MSLHEPSKFLRLHAENNYTVGRVIFACLNFRKSVFGTLSLFVKFLTRKF